MSELKRFLYQNPCPKCGKREADVRWLLPAWIPGTDVQTAGVLCRTCTRCGYVWNEQPMDAKGERAAGDE